MGKKGRSSVRAAVAALLIYALFLGGVIAGAASTMSAAAVAVDEPRQVIVLTAADTEPRQEKDKTETAAKAVIYCTHTSEEYAGQERTAGVAGGVLSAARALAGGLEEKGIDCILLEQVFDAPDWNEAYGNSLAALERVKAEHPEIELFVDVHRDSPVEGLDTHYEAAGTDYAKMMLIIGSNVNLPHPDWEQNRDFAYALQAKINAAMPGLMRDARIYNGRYNQHIGKKAILVEIGSSLNTTAEAENSARVLADAIAAELAE